MNTAKTFPGVPRGEYPRPQMVRSEWLCLNGPWQFEIDAGDSGLERGLLNRGLKDRITVPFCPESTLSGIGQTDFLNAVWYKREVEIPAAWKNQRVLLHFQAIDYDSTIWVNGQEVARHRGGFAPITCDLGTVAGQKLTITVRARDDHRAAKPKGKQSALHDNYGCLYTRTTGIWQTVWMEPVPAVSLGRPRLTPDVGNSMIRLEQSFLGSPKGLSLRAVLKDKQGPVSTAQCAVADFATRLDLPIPAERRKLWQAGEGNLYDIDIQLLDAKGKVIDEIASYAGLRSVAIDGKAIRINGKSVFQRLVLDQGYYADGILTAPSEQALIDDIQLSLDAGFNGARLHQKVFEERFLYHCDRMGYLVWGEFADWGSSDFGPNEDHQKHDSTYITQWLEVIQRDYSHPAIIGWCPLNECWQWVTDRIKGLDDVIWGMYLATKALDSTRPVLDASGYSHRVRGADVYDCHDYEQDPVKLAAKHAGLAQDKPFVNTTYERQTSIPYAGQPFFVSEFGGMGWDPDAKAGDGNWGYSRPKSIEEFYERFEGLCKVLLDDVNMFGYCYTQLTDVYQEINGIYRFDRRPKFDMDRIRCAQERPAAIESL